MFSHHKKNLSVSLRPQSKIGMWSKLGTLLLGFPFDEIPLSQEVVFDIFTKITLLRG